MIQGLQRAMLTAYDSYKKATGDIEKNVERLASGSRIPKFSDEEIEPEPITRWQKVKKWFMELPIWSIK